MTFDINASRGSDHPDSLPPRILLVDDDDLELELMADRLKSIGFEVATAANGNEALARLEREWFPLLITDREMPVMDGIELVEQLRSRGIDDMYVIMLTVRDAGVDYERGYLAGADDYLTKKLPDVELLSRVQKGFTTLAMRQSLRQAQAKNVLQGSIDAQSGAYTREHLLLTLQSECRRAERYGRNLAVMTVAIDMACDDAAAAKLRRIADTIRAVVRAHVDWIARIDGALGEPVFVIVLPEAATADAVGIKHRLETALRSMPDVVGPDAEPPHVSFGFASLENTRTERRTTEPLELVKVAERCRACLRGRGSVQLAAVQASVAQGLAICCRHGYAVESQCHFMCESHPQRATTTETSAA